jgi:hypothetical protein
METGIQQVIQAFDELGKAEQHQVLVQLLRRSVRESYPSPPDGELRQFADEVFLEFDRAEDLG